MPRPLLPWLAPTTTSAPSVPPPAPVQEPARTDRWNAPTPEVIVARKSIAPGKARRPRGGDRHAANAPTQPAVKSEPPAPTPVSQPDACEGPLAGADEIESDFSSTTGAVPPAVDTYSPEEIANAVDELLDPVHVAEVVGPGPKLHEDVLSLLAKTQGERDDLRADQALPPRFKVVDRKGNTIAQFHGCEHATHCSHTIGAHGVIRLEDNKPMTERAR